MNVLECNGIVKSYKSNRPVLNGLTLHIPAGRIVGLLGPNGCGKSTFIKLVAGLLQPDSGEIRVCGEEVGEKSKALISYLPERTYFDSGMKVTELIAFFKDFYEDFDSELAMKLLADLSVDVTAKLRTLSKGTKEKVQLVLVMARRAKLYLLDEPIAGVDPAAREYILRTIISNYNPEASIVITTHLITDVEQVLDDFVFLGFGGKVVMSGNVEDTRNESGRSIDALFKEVYKC